MRLRPPRRRLRGASWASDLFNCTVVGNSAVEAAGGVSETSVKNCIIYYNATILSHLLAHKENTGDKYGADLVKEVSPVAWQHINLTL